MIKDEISKEAQACFQGCPTVVLGSGASMPHGLPSMDILSSYLKKQIWINGELEVKAWTLVQADFEANNHLEAALEGKQLPQSLLKKIVSLTWDCVNEKDKILFDIVCDDGDALPLGILLSGLFDSTHTTVNVVTTNYDRVAEYACNSHGLMFQTGFTPGYLQKWESSNGVRYYHGRKTSRVVKIWKIHGSLDWFLCPKGIPVGLPTFTRPTESYEPLIVTPGLNKYEKITEDPFRTTINGADDALKKASAMLCVGYGFRDKQIHPKIEQRCQEKNIPIVVLAKELTDEAKDFLKNQAGSKYMGIEESAAGSRVFTNKYPAGVEVDGVNYWMLSEFNKLIF